MKGFMRIGGCLKSQKNVFLVILSDHPKKVWGIMRL